MGTAMVQRSWGEIPFPVQDRDLEVHLDFKMEV